MNRDQAVADVQQGLGFRTDRADEIVSALKRTQRIFEMGKTLPYFLREEDATLTLLEGEDSVALPSGFLREVERNSLLRYQSSGGTGWTWLAKGSHDETRSTVFSTDAGFPSHYVLRKSTILFNRPASEDVAYRWDYYKSGELLQTGDVENAWLQYAPDVLIGGAGQILCRILGDSLHLTYFQELQSVAWDAVLKETAAREVSNRPIILGRNT